MKRNPFYKSPIKIAFSFLLLITFVTAVCPGSSLSPGAVEAFTVPSLSVTTFTIDPGLFFVSIPDANLNAALHTACGVPESEALTYGDLAALTGNLNISSKNIANLEGVQYCVNISRLTAGNNPLDDLPDMSIMDDLEYLILSNCRFTAVPATITAIPRLLYLNMSENDITSADSLSGCPRLQSLSLRVNQIETLPDSFALPQIISLDLSYNELDAVPTAVFGMSTLYSLMVIGNELSELPEQLAFLPALEEIAASDNKIRSIPDNFGSSRISKIYLSMNRINAIPESLFASSRLKKLDLSINRLTRVPEEITNIVYDALKLDFNYIDVTPGSSNRVILDAVNASTKEVMNQLTPIRDLSAAVTGNSIQVSWTLSPDTESSTYTTKVKNYIVYLNESGALTELAILDKTAATFVETGLAAAVERKYTLAVEYEIVAPLVSTTSRHYTSITARTSEPTPTPTTTTETTTAATTTASETTGSESSGETTTTASATSSSGETAATSVEPSATESGENGGQDGVRLPSWLLLTVAVIAGAGVIATTILALKIKRRRA